MEKDRKRHRDTQTKRQRESWKFFPKEEEVFRFSPLWFLKDCIWVYKRGNLSGLKG